LLVYEIIDSFVLGQIMLVRLFAKVVNQLKAIGVSLDLKGLFGGQVVHHDRVYWCLGPVADS